MKNLLSIVLCTIMLSFASCSGDFLDLSPQNNSNEGTFFQTEDQFTQALNGAYNGLRTLSARQGYLMGEMRSDNTHYTRYNTDRGIHILYRENIADFIVDNQNQWVGEMWNGCYSGIARCNTLIGRLEKAGLDEAFTGKTLGQAKFIRALFYFQLVQCFGGVPLYLTEVTSADNAFLGRSTVEEVYVQILNDADDAIARLSPVSFPQNGAATQGAARMLKAYALMTMPNRNYAAAEAELKEIMKHGYELLPDYADVFDPSKKNGKESIFDIQYQMGDQGQQSDWLYYFMPKTQEGEMITGVPISNTMLTGGWNVPTPAMIASYEKGDLRLDPSIAVAAGKDDNGLMILEGIYKVGDPAIANHETAIPFVNKYRHQHNKTENTDDNWPVFRYADALLLMAECLVEQGRAAEAAPYVNQVRNRAGLPDISVVTAEVVANERKHELAFENHRWYDLVRIGKALEIMTAYGQYIKTVDKDLPARTYQIKPEYLLYPIPYRELQINSLLTPNPGY